MAELSNRSERTIAHLGRKHGNGWALTAAFAMNVWMRTGSAVSFTTGTTFTTGGRIIMSVTCIQHWIIRCHQSVQHGGEMGNEALPEKILFTGCCIECWGLVTMGKKYEPSSSVHEKHDNTRFSSEDSYVNTDWVLILKVVNVNLVNVDTFKWELPNYKIAPGFRVPNAMGEALLYGGYPSKNPIWKTNPVMLNSPLGLFQGRGLFRKSRRPFIAGRIIVWFLLLKKGQ